MVTNPTRIMRRLTAAEGYLELGMPQQALNELEAIGNPGPFQIPFLWMTGEALKAQGRFDEAVTPLRQVARALPMPISQRAWESVCECLEKSGHNASQTDVLKMISALEATIDMTARTENGMLRVEVPELGEFVLKLEPGNTLSITFERKAG